MEVFYRLQSAFPQSTFQLSVGQQPANVEKTGLQMILENMAELS